MAWGEAMLLGVRASQRPTLPAPEPAGSTILPPSARTCSSSGRCAVVGSIEEYLVALMGAEQGAGMHEANIIGETVPTVVDELLWTLPAEAG
jgi:hypothetical protein